MLDYGIVGALVYGRFMLRMMDGVLQPKDCKMKITGVNS